ncbi:hypothetical protein H6P81_006833 [Aristolochia fimbriata]|uniref:Uncharacterized protein n=1 Tax=Aristolochia fimbriata TaxID=158543 RepID=A0AAV7EZA1_ARIFI|nr:hypothetical protein H6P81_006833 [Aristolochia fimbriata]
MLLMRKHDLPKVGLTPPYQKEEEDAQSSPLLAKSEQALTVSFPPCITFQEEDTQLGMKNHNRLLFVSSYIRDHKINRILVDCGSAINILPIRMMKNVGLSAGDLSPSSLLIQGFNQEGQRMLGMINLKLHIGDIVAETPFQVIVSRTSYNLFLGRPWLHANGVVPLTHHQCFKYWENSEQKMVYADESLFTEAKASFADAKFYLTTRPTATMQVVSPKQPAHNNQPAHGHKPAVATPSPTQRNVLILRYIPLPQRKKGEAPLVANHKTQPTPLTEKVTPLPKLEERSIVKQFPNLAQLPATRSNEGFDPNAYRLMARARGNLTKDQIHEKPPIILPILTPEQEKLRNEGHRINQGRLGLGYQKETPIKIYRPQAKQIKITRKASTDVHQVSVGQTLSEKKNASNPVIIYTLKGAIARARAYDSVMVNHISVADDSQEDDDFVLKEALATFEEGGQSTIDELKKPSIRPVKQSQRRFWPELVPEIEKEVSKLIAANFIREVKYPSWIANIVPVKKKNGQIWVCVDFRDLNKACLKDDFPLPITELMVDAMIGHEALSFMDGSSSYNQIRMDPKDEELTVFRTPKGIFSYKVMPFGLKNVGATYQKAMQNIFDDFLHKRVEGIEIDQSKIDAIQKIPEPRNISELKSFQGHLAYIRRFISNLAGRCQPFSRLLKNNTPFEWDESCRNAFNNIKAYLTKSPVLVAPIVDMPYLLYIAAQEKSVGAVLAQCDEDNKERSLYYPSRTEFEINFVLQCAIKGQALANFLADHLVPAEWELTEEFQHEEIVLVEVLPPWEMYFDGAARRNGAGAGVLFVSPRRDLLPYSFVLTHNYSNNEAEYQAILLGLSMVVEMKLLQLNIYGDSALVIKQLTEEFKVKKLELVPFWRHAGEILAQIPEALLHYVPRSKNGPANALAGIVATLAQFDEWPSQVPICERWVIPPPVEEETEEEQIEQMEESFPISVSQNEAEDWREPISNFLRNGIVPVNLRERVQIRRAAPKSAPSMLIKRRGAASSKRNDSGICGAHQAGPKLHLQVKRLGYFWPTMLRDATEMARTCKPCQLHADYIHQPPEPLHPTIASWPFEAWGMDIIGVITPKSDSDRQYLVAATDYFSKWAAAAAYREVKATTAADFIRTQIIYRYGVPRHIVMDNGTPFRNRVMDRFCEKFCIQQRTSSAYNLAANGLAEAVNKTLCKILKKTIGANKKSWDEKLGEALWAYRTSFRTPSQSTPYSLLPLEVQLPSLRIAIREGLTTEECAQLRLAELESLDEQRLEAQQRLECYQSRMTRAFNKKSMAQVIPERRPRAHSSTANALYKQNRGQVRTEMGRTVRGPGSLHQRRLQARHFKWLRAAGNER